MRFILHSFFSCPKGSSAQNQGQLALDYILIKAWPLKVEAHVFAVIHVVLVCSLNF